MQKSLYEASKVESFFARDTIHDRESFLSQEMSLLPADRLEKTAPCEKVCLDVFIHDGRSTRRTKASKKIWVLLFTCFYSEETAFLRPALFRWTLRPSLWLFVGFLQFVVDAYSFVRTTKQISS